MTKAVRVECPCCGKSILVIEEEGSDMVITNHACDELIKLQKFADVYGWDMLCDMEGE